MLKVKRYFTKEKPSTLLDVTPFADIVFLLLIFFMLSSTFVVEPGIKLRLPKSKTAEIEQDDKIILTVSADKKIYLADRLIDIDDVEKQIKLMLSEKEKTVILRADGSVNYGLVIDVLDKAKLAGAKKIAVATEKKK